MRKKRRRITNRWKDGWKSHFKPLSFQTFVLNCNNALKAIIARHQQLSDLNEHLVCTLCNGYYIDATTIIECLHSFCRSCIVRYLATHKCCPKCEVQAHRTRPLLNIRSDKTLQDIVYKLVPNLSKNEMARKQFFSRENGIPMDIGAEVTLINKSSQTRVSSKHFICFSIETDRRNSSLSSNSQWIKVDVSLPKRYMRCPDVVRVATLIKLIKLKLQKESLEVIIFCKGEVIPESYTLTDVANVFAWKSESTLLLTYMVFMLVENMENEVVNVENVDGLKSKNHNIVNQMKPTQGTLNKPQILSSSENIKEVEPIETDHTVVDNFISVSKEGSEATPKFILPKPRTQPGQNKELHSNQGRTLSSYSVMNVPLKVVEEMELETPESKNEEKPNTAVTHSHTDNYGVKVCNTPTTSGPEKIKNIDSIANRLQMKQWKQTLETSSDLPHSSSNKSLNTNSHHHPPKMISSVNLQERDRIGKLNNLTMDEAHSLALECVRSTMRPNKTVSNFSVPRFQAYNIPRVTTPSNFIQLSRASEGTNQVRMAVSHSMNKYNTNSKPLQTNMQFQRTQYQVKGSPKVQRTFRRETEDLQLLSTTRQLASLRQQQKILNEIAAAVASKSTAQQQQSGIQHVGLNMKPRIAPCISSLSSSSPSSIIRSTRDIAQLKQSPSFSPVSTNPSIQHFSPQSKQKFSATTLKGSNIGYPSMNIHRGGNIDIYQNTIEKARACVREMKMKSKMSNLSQARTFAAPYAMQRDIQPNPREVPIFATTITTHTHPSSHSSTAHSSVHYPTKTVPMEILKKEYSHTGKSPTSTQATDSILAQPEQDQPLCLVVKK